MDHPFLRFDPNDERDAPCIPVLHSLWGRRRQIEPMKCLSWDLVVGLNQQTRLQPLITEPWSRLFYYNRPQYRELLLEFFASYSFSFPSQNVYRKRFGLTFRLGGRWRRLSVAQFATRMGLYTEGELDSEIFDGLHDFEDEIEKATFWAEVAEGVYDPRRAKATKLRDPLHRFIHRILVSTIMQRGDSLGNVPTRDLFYLYCLIRGIHCNIAHCLAYFLTTSSGKLASSHICGGAYITQLADSFGLLTEENIASFTHVCDTPPLDMRTLRYMQIVEQTPVGMRLRGRDGRIWDPVPEEQEDEEEEEHEEERGPDGGGPHGMGPGGFDYVYPPHDEYLDFAPTHGPDPPSNLDLWHRFSGLQVSQEELHAEQQRFNQRIDNFQTEQTRQYDLLHQIQDDQRRSFEWLFASHQSAAAFHQFDVTEPPRFDYGYSSGGAQKRSRGGHDGEASGSGPHDDEED
ncbi:hypothetical protein E3N88_00165 [Mikania micrantha]|uniref:Uncharacterized protein n=1 Tax=Mikania micrantha TaxID=192012 RepID=A0A5N6PXC1_9ASTR|nr:hypothetical protein E3N88_00165 [Mikania micrantha]